MSRKNTCFCHDISALFSAFKLSSMLFYVLMHIGDFRSIFSAALSGRKYSAEKNRPKEHFFLSSVGVFSAQMLPHSYAAICRSGIEVLVQSLQNNLVRIGVWGETRQMWFNTD